MNEEVKRLIATMLHAHSVRLLHDSSNDWKWPDGISDETKKAILELEPDYIATYGLQAPPNWLVPALLAKLLLK